MKEFKSVCEVVESQHRDVYSLYFIFLFLLLHVPKFHGLISTSYLGSLRAGNVSDSDVCY